MAARRRKKVYIGRETRMERIKAGVWWPFFCFGMAILAAGVVGFAFFKYGLPFIKELFNTGMGENRLPVSTARQITDLTGNAKEVLLTGRNANISQPEVSGDYIYFAGGSDSYGGANLVWVNRYDTTQRSTTIMDKIKRRHEMISSIAANDKYIAYFDAYYNGGGTVYYYDIEKMTTTFAANVGYGWPELSITDNNCILWTERTGTATDKLYLYSIATGEITTLAVFEDSPYGVSHPYADGNCIVWADADDRRDDPHNYSKIITLAFTDEGAVFSDYYTDMYVHNPKSNGRILAWMDTPGEDGTSLYISVGGTHPHKIAEDITAYGVGDGFVAYGSGGAVWAYFTADGSLARLTKPGEYCSLVNVQDDMVVWFDITEEDRERDILRYMHVYGEGK